MPWWLQRQSSKWEWPIQICQRINYSPCFWLRWLMPWNDPTRDFALHLLMMEENSNRQCRAGLKYPSQVLWIWGETVAFSCLQQLQRTQLFHLSFTEPGNVILVLPCILSVSRGQHHTNRSISVFASRKIICVASPYELNFGTCASKWSNSS